MLPHHINGAQIASQSKEHGAVYNPANGEVIRQVPFATTAEIEHAIKAAEKAYQQWSTASLAERARLMFAFKHLLEKNIGALAETVSLEHGKTRADAKASIQRGIDVVEFACGAPQLLKSTYSERVGRDVDCYGLRQSLGICVGITPFNFPAMIPLWMYPLALICGNTFIHKPSEKDPSTALLLADLLYEAGAPAGILNVIHGGKDVVDALISHPKVKAVSFVGSTPVAQHIYQTASLHNKRVQAFGGAKNHCLVMNDADLDDAANAIVGAAYGSSGQRCMAISVVVTIGDKTADALLERLAPATKALIIGAGDNDKTMLAPLNTPESLTRVKQYLDIGVNEGAKLIVDGRQANIPQQGFFIGASLFDGVMPKMRIYQEEIFGPVLCVMRAPDYETALSWVNHHPYGNGTAIFTQNGEVAHDFAARVQIGMVGINVPIPVPVGYHSFGGWKASAFGDLGLHGPDGIQFYTRLKTITSRWPKGKTNHGFTLPTH